MTLPPADRDTHDYREAGTRALLDVFAAGDPDEQLRMGDVLHGLSDRSFGMLLFVSTIPAFIPIPGVGGAISGPLVILIGVQLLIGLRQPWLPKFLAKRGPHRHAMARFRDLLAPWLTRLEKVVKPRLPVLLDHRVAGHGGGLRQDLQDEPHHRTSRRGRGTFGFERLLGIGVRGVRSLGHRASSAVA